MLLLQTAHCTALSAAHADAEALRTALTAADTAAKDAAAAAEASKRAEAEMEERIAVLESNLSALPRLQQRQGLAFMCACPVDYTLACKLREPVLQYQIPCPVKVLSTVQSCGQRRRDAGMR